eukprot:6459407-Amphidinium_carterae.1
MNPAVEGGAHQQFELRIVSLTRLLSTRAWCHGHLDASIERYYRAERCVEALADLDIPTCVFCMRCFADAFVLHWEPLNHRGWLLSALPVSITIIVPEAVERSHGKGACRKSTLAPLFAVSVWFPMHSACIPVAQGHVCDGASPRDNY